MNKPLHVLLNEMPEGDIATLFQKCCASESWVTSMLAGRPFASPEEVLEKASAIWSKLSEPDYLQAFAAHPQIGDVKTLQAKYANTQSIASSEQSLVSHASSHIIEQLALANQLYLKRFGFIFIIFATGKSAEEMLTALLGRVGNSIAKEIENAAAEQLKITTLRLQKIAET